jgi:hypothetical protein
MFALPHELTGMGTIRGLFHAGCNGYGKHCLGYVPHNAESRKALAEAIAKRKRKESQDEPQA